MIILFATIMDMEWCQAPQSHSPQKASKKLYLFLKPSLICFVSIRLETKNNLECQGKNLIGDIISNKNYEVNDSELIGATPKLQGISILQKIV